MCHARLGRHTACPPFKPALPISGPRPQPTHPLLATGAFDVPEQAAHAHDIGALCSGKARPEALNFPLADYQAMLPMLQSLPHVGERGCFLHGVAATIHHARSPHYAARWSRAGRPERLPAGRACLFKIEIRMGQSESCSNWPLSCPPACSETFPVLPTPQAQIVAALRSYGRLPTARPPGVSSGRLLSSPSVRSASVKESGGDEQTGGGGVQSIGLSQRPRRARKPKSSASPASRSLPPATSMQPIDWQAALHMPSAQGSATLKQGVGLGPAEQLQRQATNGSGGGTAATPGENGIKPEPISATDLAKAQQAQLQALSAALLGAGGTSPAPSGAASGSSGGLATAPSSCPPSAKAPSALLLGSPGSGARLAGFEDVLNRVMARSHELPRPDEAPGESSGGRAMHSGPKGQSGFKGVTLYKWVLAYRWGLTGRGEGFRDCRACGDLSQPHLSACCAISLSWG